MSDGDQNNGASGYFDVKEHMYERTLTIAFNGMNPLPARYHPYLFAAKDDVAVCIPRQPLHLTTEVFIQAMINRER
ncbi:MAG: hypothetical protein HY271_16895 [Deltaproteobacteria bacterium]|nr:hypothetical protein [Deltaproteobacteria bacterium]